MTFRITRRLTAAFGTAAIVGAALIAPTAALAAPSGPVLAETEAGAAGTMCQVEQGTLGWGMKERFRTYITGSIANGSWTTGDGVAYIDPALSSTGAIEPGTNLFEWTSGSGDVASDLIGGTISFTGNVNFSGHGGSLALDIGDPAIEFSDAETAYLLLAIGEPSEGATVPQVRAAKIELAGAFEAEGSELSITGAPVILTAEGAAAFNGDYGTYTSGEEMDPIYLAATVSGCEFGAVADVAVADDAEPTAEIVTTQEVQDQQAFPWVPVIIGGVALIVVVGAAIMLIAGRPTKSSSGVSTAGDADAPSERASDA